ncbi:hypothetical protein ACJQWK_00081 [Exserohilum turcicum]
MADLQPTCEDYHSDQSDEGHVEFQGRPSPNAANVSTKPSQPSDLNKEKPPAQQRVPTNIDLRSDSGPNSQRSPPAAAAPSPPPVVAPEAPTPPPPHQRPPPPPITTNTTKTRRPTQSDQPRPKIPSRTASQSSKPVVKQRRPTITQDSHPERTRRDSRVECPDPTCTKCGPNAIPQHLTTRPGIKPTQSARDVDRLSADTRSMRSDPASYYPSPPSPSTARRPAYRQEAAIIQPAVARRRPSASRPRPMSYGGEPNSQYWAPGMPAPYPSPPQEHGPPPSNSAWRNMPQYHQAPPMGSYGGPQGYPTYYNHTPPPYEGPPRPGMPSRTSFNPARNGPAPIISQAPREQQYSARYGQPQSATQARFPQQLQLQDGAYESDSESETGSSEDEEDYYEQPDPRDPRNQQALIAPAKLAQPKLKSKTKKQQRPPMRHANTTQVVDERPSRRMSHSQPQPQSLVIDDRRRKRTSKPVEEPSRRASVSRPPAPPRQIQSDYATPRGQVVVANSKSERRRSAQVYYQHYPEERRTQERPKVTKEAKARARDDARRAEEERQQQLELAERKRLNRSSKQYHREPSEYDSDDYSESEESEQEQFMPEAPAPPPQTRRRRPTDVGNGKGKERVLEHKTKRIENAAEEYISAQRGAREPLNEPIHTAARNSRTISMPSHSGSSGSERSRTNRTAVTNDNNEIRLRVDANAPLSLQFNGDMEGRTMRLIPAENGMADLVISGGRENAYHGSDRGSNADDRKALALRPSRRHTEEMTEGSSRSTRKRRDSQVIRPERSNGARPLRQRANTSSYYGE